MRCFHSACVARCDPSLQLRNDLVAETDCSITRRSHLSSTLPSMGSLESSGTEVATVDVLAAKALVDSGHYYLDVRTEEEFKNGYPDAGKVLNIPYLFTTPEGRVKNPQFMEQVLSAYSVDDNIVVGCRSGVRSLDAGNDLVKAGYKHVVNMGGGYLAWVDHGFPVKKPVEVREDEHAKDVCLVQEPAEDSKEQNELPVQKPADKVEEPVN